MKRIAELVVKYPKTIMAVILAVTLCMGYFASKVRVENAIELMFLDDDPDLIYYEEFKQRFGSSDIIAIAFKSDDVFNPEDLGLIRRLTERVRGVENVVSVLSLTNVKQVVGDKEGIRLLNLINEIPSSPEELEGIRSRATSDPLFLNNIISEDGRTTAIIIEIADLPYDDQYRRQIHRDLQRIIEEEIKKHSYEAEKRRNGETVKRPALADSPPRRFARSPVEVHLAGVPMFMAFTHNYIIRDLKIFLPISYGMLLFILFLTFRNAHGTFLPLFVVFFALVWTMGIMVLSGNSINIASSVIPPIVLVIGVAGTVHIFTHYYEELTKCPDNVMSIKETVTFIGIPCFLTSVTTAFGFGSLCISRVAPVRETGFLISAGVMFALVISLTLIPAILLYLGRPGLGAGGKLETGFLKKILTAVGRVNERYPWPILFIGALVLILSIVGMTMIRVETNVMKYFKKETEITRATKFMDKNLSGVGPLDIIIQGKEEGVLKEPASLKDIQAVQDYIGSVDEVTKTFSIIDYLKLTNRVMHGDDEDYFKIPESRELVAQYLLLYSIAGGSGDLNKLINYDYTLARITARFKDTSSARISDIVRDVRDFISKNVNSELEVNFAGTTNLFLNLLDTLISSQIRSLILAVFIIAIVMIITLRSIRLGLLSMIPNIMPILAAMGFMGWADIELNVSTCMMPSIGIGLAVDDTIHFLVRFRRELRLDGDYGASMHRTLNSTGRAITFTSVILFCGFMVLTLSNFGPNLYFGLLSSFIMAIALLGDLFVLPALLLVFKPRFPGV